MAPRRIPLAERFWAKVEKSETCWLWRGPVGKNGYGSTCVNYRHIGAHRLAWELARGPITPATCVCHTCDTPLCVNPSHLFLGTQRDNIRDARLKGRLSHVRCKRGHEMTPENRAKNGRGITCCRLCKDMRCRKVSRWSPNFFAD
jgi:hypothetical protein